MSSGIPLHDLLGLTFERPERGSTAASVRMPVAPPAFGSTANLHGGAIATLVDLACALAAARATDFDPALESLVTSDMHVRYLGVPRSAEVVARAEVQRVGRQVILVACGVTATGAEPAGRDRLIALADFSLMRVPLRRPLGVPPDPTDGDAP